MDKLRKSFLRSCINFGCLNTDEANKIMVNLCKIYKVEDCNIKDVVEEINGHLSPFNQKLTFFKHPLVEATEFLVFGYTFETEAARVQMHYSDTERNYFLKLMEAAIKDADYGISWMNVYSVTDMSTASGNEKKLTKQRMQELIKKWKNQGYFLEKGETLYLGPRIIVEYGTHLKMHYGASMENCPLCDNFVLWDIRCQDCGIKIHRDCIRKYLTRKSNCPACQKKWSTRLSLSQ